MIFAGVGNQGTHDAKILMVNKDQGSVAQWIISRLQNEKGIIVVDKLEGLPIDEQQAERLLLANRSEYGLVMVFPSGFSERLVEKRKTQQLNNKIQFIADPATDGQNLNPIERLIKIQVMEVAGALSALDKGHQILRSLARGQKSIQMENLVLDYAKATSSLPEGVRPNIEFERVALKGLMLTRPIKPEEQNVPGYTIFGIFFIVQVIGNTLLCEKESGTLVRLLIAPISRAEILLGKLIPFFEMPRVMQKIAFCVPHAWSLKGFQDILVRGYDSWAVLPTTAHLFGFALLFYLVALGVFVLID